MLILEFIKKLGVLLLCSVIISRSTYPVQPVKAEETGVSSQDTKKPSSIKCSLSNDTLSVSIGRNFTDDTHIRVENIESGKEAYANVLMSPAGRYYLPSGDDAVYAVYFRNKDSGWTKAYYVVSEPKFKSVKPASGNKAVLKWGKVQGASRYVVYKQNISKKWSKTGVVKKNICKVTGVKPGCKFKVVTQYIKAGKTYKSLDSSVRSI